MNFVAATVDMGHRAPERLDEDINPNLIFFDPKLVVIEGGVRGLGLLVSDNEPAPDFTGAPLYYLSRFKTICPPKKMCCIGIEINFCLYSCELCEEKICNTVTLLPVKPLISLI